jgi:hypothetical protein
VVSVAESLILTEDEDEPVWMRSSFGVYSSHSLYSIINFRGVMHVYISSVWKMIIPPRVHFLLWLLSKNKLLTRDNMEKKEWRIKPVFSVLNRRQCIICVVAKKAWESISGIFGFSIGSNFESMAR